MATLLKEKTGVNGHVWVGRSLVPLSVFFSLFFVGALISELTIIFLAVLFSLIIELSFFFLTMLTGLAVTFFIFEARSVQKRT